MALKFISGNPRVLLGRVPEVEGVAAFTFAAWVRIDNLNADGVIVMRGNTFDDTAPWVLYRDEVAYASSRQNTFAAHVRTNVGQIRIESAAGASNDTAWHHVALVFEAGVAGGLRMVVDGVVDPYAASTVGHTSVVTNTAGVHLGFDSVSSSFQGAMADVAICNAAIPTSDIARLAAKYSALAVPSVRDSLIVYHDLIRGVNRPGIGGVATTAGTFAHEAHPPLRFPSSPLLSTSSAHTLVRGPWRGERGLTLASAAAAGELFIPGAARGAVHSIGEDHP
ncbi:LamG domain-containing protein [Aeoliella sp. SH292]|uniref:LamG domain-containing protein n=1 Tax=Aeoliella sp. SH292 TaxID=3454464 RepID=UPI003F9D5207